MKITHGLLLSLVLFVVGCGGGATIGTTETEQQSGSEPGNTSEPEGNGDTDSGGENTNTPEDNTGEITEGNSGEIETLDSLTSKYAGATFVSIETLELGPTPTGVAMGNWSVSFTADTVTWSYSDILETGSYSLNDRNNPVANFSGREIAFSGNGSTLNWDSRVYHRLDSGLFDSQQALQDYFDGSTYTSIEELDLGYSPNGGLAMGHWTVRFDGSEYGLQVQDTVQVGTYQYTDGSSMLFGFGGGPATRVYVLTGDQLLINSVIYEKTSIGQFDSQETLVAYLDGTSYKSTGLEQVGPVANGVVGVGHWFLYFAEDTFTWNHLDTEEAGTYLYAGEDSFTALLPDRELTIEISRGDILWDGVRYKKQ